MKSILVVDDEPICREPLAEALRFRGYRVTVAAGGTDILQAMEQAKPDLVLLDILMPRVEGISVLERIRSDIRFKHVPVILLTNVTDRSFVMQAHALGAAAYMLKSEFSMDDLVRRIEDQLSASAVLQATNAHPVVAPTSKNSNPS
ncbi:putative transcriptional regulatory protein pdtaR [Phycisphaerae bacterium RAS2]|nr:putative transcriptional regulatory protein pdtaR [Phycisphaerae bacterium RAS2]